MVSAAQAGVMTVQFAAQLEDLHFQAGDLRDLLAPALDFLRAFLHAVQQVI